MGRVYLHTLANDATHPVLAAHVLLLERLNPCKQDLPLTVHPLQYERGRDNVGVVFRRKADIVLHTLGAASESETNGDKAEHAINAEDAETEARDDDLLVMMDAYDVLSYIPSPRVLRERFMQLLRRWRDGMRSMGHEDAALPPFGPLVFGAEFHCHPWQADRCSASAGRAAALAETRLAPMQVAFQRLHGTKHLPQPQGRYLNAGFVCGLRGAFRQVAREAKRRGWLPPFAWQWHTEYPGNAVSFDDQYYWQEFAAAMPLLFELDYFGEVVVNLVPGITHQAVLEHVRLLPQDRVYPLRLVDHHAAGASPSSGVRRRHPTVVLQEAARPLFLHMPGSSTAAVAPHAMALLMRGVDAATARQMAVYMRAARRQGATRPWAALAVLGGSALLLLLLLCTAMTRALRQQPPHPPAVAVAGVISKKKG